VDSARRNGFPLLPELFPAQTPLLLALWRSSNRNDSIEAAWLTSYAALPTWMIRSGAANILRD
jgi:hypothetical protein